MPKVDYAMQFLTEFIKLSVQIPIRANYAQLRIDTSKKNRNEHSFSKIYRIKLIPITKMKLMIWMLLQNFQQFEYVHKIIPMILNINELYNETNETV